MQGASPAPWPSAASLVPRVYNGAGKLPPPGDTVCIVTSQRSASHVSVAVLVSCESTGPRFVPFLRSDALSAVLLRLQYSGRLFQDKGHF